MIAPLNPPLRIAYSTSSRVSLRTLKFGPSVRSPPETLPVGREPSAAAASSVWQPLHRCLKRIAPWCTARSRLGTLTSLPQPAARAATRPRQHTRAGRGLDMAAHIIRRHAEDRDSLPPPD